MLKVNVGNKELLTIPYRLIMTPADYVEFQLRLILGDKAHLISKGELKSLSYMYLYPNIKEATNQLISLHIRNSKKSVDNDLSKFRSLNWISTQEDNIVFNSNITINKTPEYYLIRIEPNIDARD